MFLHVGLTNSKCYNRVMKSRIEIFHAYKNHAWLHKVYDRLSKSDIQICEEFIQSHDHLPKGEFEYAINRMFLDKPNKPKNYPMILEMLTCTNSAIDKDYLPTNSLHN